MTSVGAYTRPAGLSQTMIIVLELGLLVVVCLQRPPALRRLLMPVPAWLYVASAASTTYLALSTFDALVVVASLGLPLAVAAVVAIHVPFGQFLKLSENTLFVAVAASVVVGVAYPVVGITHGAFNAGSLRGLYSQRNNLGYTVALGVILLLCRLLVSKVGEITKIAHASVYGAAVLWCDSTSAILICVLAVIAFVVRTRSSKLPGSPPVLHYYAIILCAPVAYLAIPSIIETLGKEQSLAGRQNIWAAAWKSAQPVLFTGYGRSPRELSEGSIADEVASLMHYYVGSIHNGYLAVLLESGLISLVLLTCYAIFTVGRSLSTYTRDPNSGCAAFALWISSMLVIYNVIETRISVNIGWLLLALVNQYLSQSRRRLHLPAPPGDQRLARLAPGRVAAR